MPVWGWEVAVALTVAGFLAASALMLIDMRHDTRDRAVTAEVNLLNALPQDIARNVELYDLSLRAVVDGLAEPGFANISPRMQDLVLYDHAAIASDLGAMLVLDAAGRLVRGMQARVCQRALESRRCGGAVLDVIRSGPLFEVARHAFLPFA